MYYYFTFFFSLLSANFCARVMRLIAASRFRALDLSLAFSVYTILTTLCDLV